MAEIDDLLDDARNWNAMKNKAGGSNLGHIQYASDLLPRLKDAVQKGKLTVTDYMSVAEPLIGNLSKAVGAYAAGGSGNASQVNPIWSALQADGFVTANNGRWVSPLPFSRSEYAKLPENVLPTQEEAKQGTFDSRLAPMERYRPPTPVTPQVNPGPTTPTQPTVTQPTVTQPTTTLPGPAQTTTTPYGGLEGGMTEGGFDEKKLLAEAELAKKLRGETLDQQRTLRQQMLDDLSGVLVKQQQAQLGDQMPGIYEDLNTRGLLRSSALGEKVGLEASKLARQTSEQLALRGITDRDSYIGGLGTVQDTYLTGRENALNRRFSLEDFDRQLRAGKELGAAAIPNISQPSGKGAGALQGGIGGAATGASVGGAPGAIIGGLAGSIGGGQLGGKS